MLMASLLFLSGCSVAPSITDTDLASEKSMSYNLPKRTIEKQNGVEEKFSIGLQDEKLYSKRILKAIQIRHDLPAIKGGLYSDYLPAGHIDAAFFKQLLKHGPSVVVLLHQADIEGNIQPLAGSLYDFETSYGLLETDKAIIEKLEHQDILDINNGIVSAKYGGYSPLPYIAYFSCQSKIIPLVIDVDTSEQELAAIVVNLTSLLPEDAVIAMQADLSRFQREMVADFHDQLSMSVIRNFDYGRLDLLDTEKLVSLRLFLNLMQYYGAEKVVYEKHGNSGAFSLVKNAPSTIGYYWAYFAAGKKQDRPLAALLHFGDIMLDRDVKYYIDMHGSDYLLENLSKVNGGFFKGVDLVTGNLEGPFADSRRQTGKAIAFRFDPREIEFLKKYNFNLLNLANNHIMDMGYGGLYETMANLENSGLEYYGVRAEETDDPALIKKVGGLRLAFIGFEDVNSRVNLPEAKQRITELRTLADYVIVNMHWGAEYRPYNSNSRQRYLAHELIDGGADVVVGHHPHVIQEVEVYKDRLIFYSLGNFIFDQYWSQDTQEGLALGLVFYNDRIRAHLYPIESIKLQTQLMNFEKTAATLNKISDASRLGDYNFSDNTLTIKFN